VAALLTVGLILVPIDLSSRVALALLAAPACGLAIHVTAVMRGSWD
jgi:hypothetical protein